MNKRKDLVYNEWTYVGNVALMFYPLYFEINRPFSLEVKRSKSNFLSLFKKKKIEPRRKMIKTENSNDKENL
jgi:hypothetical protein